MLGKKSITEGIYTTEAAVSLAEKMKVDITKSKYIPKPSVEPLITYLNKNNINLKTCVYFEDLEKNLENAHKYGITTVHIEDKINKKKTSQPFIDFRFKSILEALHTINKTYN